MGETKTVDLRVDPRLLGPLRLSDPGGAVAGLSDESASGTAFCYEAALRPGSDSLQPNQLAHSWADAGVHL